jgi:hypothetical protein
MTRAYALQRLLQHGPMTRRELVDVTGWGERGADKAIRQAVSDGRIAPASERGCNRRMYRLPAAHFLPTLG